MTNSQRFIDAYNRTDNALHSRFGFKPSMAFTDAVRRAASINSIVRRYEDDLIDYARLRNAIVHKSDLNKSIAEPHDDVTEHFEHIADILSTPPLATAVAHAPVTLTPETPFADAVKMMALRDFSVMPVIKKHTVVGVFTNKNVVMFAAKHIGAFDAAASRATVADAMSDGSRYFTILPDCTVDDVLSVFERNRKLRMVIITDGGKADGALLGVLTIGDIAAISKMLDAY